MNAPFQQETRAGRLTTTLGQENLALLRFNGSDYVNKLFEYSVDALSPTPALDFDALIGTHATVEIETQDHDPKVFDGLVTQAKWAGVGENGYRYALILRPWLWVASKRRNQRIFHTKTVVQILEELFSTYSSMGNPALDNRLTKSYPELEYTVQYRESDLDFATRLMERFGISYHFTHQVGSHTMVLTDSLEQHDFVVGEARIYKPFEGAAQDAEEHFWEWAPERNMTTGAVRMIDYNFKKPMAAMEVDQVGDAAYANGQIESFDYPGGFLEGDDGKQVAALRTAQERGGDIRHRAVGDCTSLGAGMKVSVSGDQLSGVTGSTFVCLSATHSYVSDSYGSGGAESDGMAYSGSYVLMPDTAPLAPRRKTQSPVIQGAQTAMVVGDGEIDCDEFGRILVRFHWDLSGAKSMRCRVAQNWAGGGWGGMVIPRIGMEVIVQFLEGDPDNPVVTGCVYNQKNMPNAGLPASKTQSGFRTNTHEGSGYNEMMFEDQAGKEEIRVHAQKDLNRTILDNETTFLRDGNRKVDLKTGDELKVLQTGHKTTNVDSGNLTENVALTRAVTATVVQATANGGEAGPGVISYTATDEISLTVGNSTIVLTPDAVVIRHGSSQILLNEGFIDQVAGMIHLNKDSAG
ncbi:type VI secretion system Vgr family protein [Loktanella agnita]|uniref:type VI secretion system Vgr family protein n=1 Tax=Loktanella agnita TaxID=287097 RepID=UPI003985D84B